MFCPRCGDKIEQNEVYCNKCGNYLGNNFNNKNISNNVYTNNSINTAHIPNNLAPNNKKMIFIGIGIGVCCLLLIFGSVFVINNMKGKYYFSNNNYESDEVEVKNNKTEKKKKSKYSTAIITDNRYSGVEINEKQDAYNLIIKDSVSQKNNCPSEILEIENEMIEKYNITAVNLCEMNIEFAKEVSNVFKKIYDEYPGVRENLTNLSLVNASMSEGYIAAFMPLFTFAESNSSSGYPWVIKTQVLLNTTYFLNTVRLEASVTDGSTSGHFPPNATMYSPVAHELGHYLSFLAMMKHYEINSILLVDEKNITGFYDLYNDFVDGEHSLSMIKEAYENYKKDTNTTLKFDEWRATISNYAVAKDNSGNYIYDETIAEGFHDVYLNGDNAKDASKYVVNVLKEKLKG